MEKKKHKNFSEAKKHLNPEASIYEGGLQCTWRRKMEEDETQMSIVIDTVRQQLMCPTEWKEESGLKGTCYTARYGHENKRVIKSI